jgi:molybdenum cofactor biosynthesis enzyme MoaA
MRYRSQNSDLLLPEYMEAQIKEAVDYALGRRGLPIHRVTAFVTHKCNMFCHYCAGPHLTALEGDSERKKLMLIEDLTVDQYSQYINEIVENTDFIEHVHFTGGEATVKDYLPELVAATSDHGVPSSVTSNGLAGPDFYRSLIDNGLTEIRVSFDSSDAETFDKSVKVTGAFDRVIESIGEITRLRDEDGRDIFLVINACVGEANLTMIKNTMSFMMSLNPNDLKFLLIVQDKEFVIKNKSSVVINELHNKLNNYPRDRYYLLRRKIDSLFVPEASGVEDAEAQKLMTKCYIPMTERTIDGQHYYPCSIYTRHYGEPIGSMDEPFKLQQEKTMRFVDEHNCRQDPICQKYCVNCCKLYNVIMNVAVEADKKVIDTGEILQSSPVLESELAAAKERAKELFATVPERWQQELYKLFLIIKPYGLDHQQELLSMIAKEGIEIEHSLCIDSWHELACFLYSKDERQSTLLSGLERTQAFSKLEGNEALLLLFKAQPSPDILLKLKYKMRVQVPSKRYQLQAGSSSRPIHVTVAHSPDEVNLKRENTLLYNAFPELKRLKFSNDKWQAPEPCSISV